MAREAGISQANVQRLWAASTIKPHLSTDRDTGKVPWKGGASPQAAPDAPDVRSTHTRLPSPTLSGRSFAAGRSADMPVTGPCRRERATARPEQNASNRHAGSAWRSTAFPCLNW
jgi:hypothetical protein